MNSLNQSRTVGRGEETFRVGARPSLAPWLLISLVLVLNFPEGVGKNPPPPLANITERPYPKYWRLRPGGGI